MQSDSSEVRGTSDEVGEGRASASVVDAETRESPGGGDRDDSRPWNLLTRPARVCCSRQLAFRVGNAGGPCEERSRLNIMNSRVIALLAQDKDRWQLAGDQLFIDMDLSDDNLPAGTHLAIDSAVIEVTAQPHTGCLKFMARFGPDAMRFVNSAVGKQLHLRGINARVVQLGVIRVGSVVRKIRKRA